MSKRERQLEEQNALLKAQIKLLEQKVDTLTRRIYGSSSEKVDPNQLLLLEEAERKKDEASVCELEAYAEAEEQNTPSPKKAAARKPRVPENLPVEKVYVDPDEVKASPEQWRLMGEEVTEQLDYEPGRFKRRQIIRRKYVRKDNPYTPPVIAPLHTLADGCYASPGLMASIVVSKYCDHLPLYRQQQIFRHRYDVHIPRQTMARWMGLATDSLQLIYKQMQQELLQKGDYLQVDETPIAYLHPGSGRTQQGYFWVYGKQGYDTIFDWQCSRSASCLNNIIPVDFIGILQCDGYSAYTSYQNKVRPQLHLAGCWAHVRRKFFEAKDHDRRMRWVLLQIYRLYQIERKLRHQRAGPKLREVIRQSQSRPIINRIKHMLVYWKKQQNFLPKSNSGKAIDYALNHWDKLEVYLNHGQVAIDNNHIENAIRPTAIGKKNWLFIGAEQTGGRSAILYTIIEACRKRNINPYAYLKDVLEKIPTSTNWDIKNLTPKAWAENQNNHLRHAA